MSKTCTQYDIDRIVNTDHFDPFQLLGMHEIEIEGSKNICVRAFLPDAREVFVFEAAEPKNRYQMNKVDDRGFFEVVIKRKDIFKYNIEKIFYDANTTTFYDSYAFPPILTDYDLHLFKEGNHHRIYEKLGAHYHEFEGIGGICFAVWAPNAKRVSVIGDFNMWDGRRHVMRVHQGVGVWEIFVPGLPMGSSYKFEIKSKQGNLIEKADPYAFASEVRPKTSSIVYDYNKYEWNDSEWIENRKKGNLAEAPMSVYEVHPGSWMRVPEDNNRFLTYRELAVKLTDYVKKMNYTHIELLPVAEHPFDGSWGYQVTGYFAPTSRYGTPNDFMYFVDYLHQNGIGIIVDWVPAHFPKDWHGFMRFDGSCLYEHEDPKKGEHMDWATLIFNYGRNEVKNFLISNAIFWFDKYHIDGIRVDAVASMLYLDYSRKAGEWLPNQYGGRENLEAIDFLKYLNTVIYQYFPGTVTIAEESTAWPAVSRPTYVGGLGFGMKWNMGWMNDTLKYFEKDPIYRRYHHNTLTFPLIYAFHENFVLVLSHDEVVHGKKSLLDKMPGDVWQKFANLRLLMGYMYAMPGKKLLFMGGELGQWNEWNFNSSIDWHLLNYESHHKYSRYISDLNYLYKTEKSFHELDFAEGGFEWIDFSDSDRSVISFIRKAKNSEDTLIFVFNFTPMVYMNYRVGVPQEGHYDELLNSDSSEYWGSNIGNFGGFQADHYPWQGRAYSMNLNIPPLALIILKHRK